MVVAAISYAMLPTYGRRNHQGRRHYRRLRAASALSSRINIKSVKIVFGGKKKTKKSAFSIV